MKNLLFFWGLFMVVWALSCTTSYRAKQDAKLFGKVAANERVLPKVGELWNALHPVTQKTIYIKGKDSVIRSIDTLVVDVVKDSIIKIACPNLNMDSLRKASVLIVKEFHYFIDTFITPDTNCVHILDKVQINLSNAQGKNEQLNTQLKSTTATSNKKTWFLIGAGIIIAGLIFLLFKRK